MSGDLVTMVVLGIQRLLYNLIARHLTKPRKSYRQVVANDIPNLKRHLRKGDIILIDGDQRVSEVIKYLSQSSWSHAAIYVGNELAARDDRDRALLHGVDASEVNHMIVEALMDGVVASPLSKYASFNIRVCRPRNLRAVDTQQIMDEILGQLGYHYDVKHIVDLARYLFPVSLIPRRFRRKALQLGSGLTREVICSTMIARAFHNVGFPILPEVMPDHDAPAPWYTRTRDRVLLRKRFHPGIFRQQSPELVTPRDFDLSPYFEVLKINLPDHASFDYRRIRWEPVGNLLAGDRDSEPESAAG
jgi:hypothetical protein